MPIASPSPSTSVRHGEPTSQNQLSVVLCGSFHRDSDDLRRLHCELSQHFRVLSPRDVDFVEPDAPFVRLSDELTDTEAVIEERHLAALRAADFVWLYAPSGYVGTSAAMELGVAAALGIPVFSDLPPTEPVLAARVLVVSEPEAVNPEELEEATDPGRGLSHLQRYYRTVASRRGWSDETPHETLLLLTEEVDELSQAMRNLEALTHNCDVQVEEVGAEMADVQLYLAHLANTLGIELAQAVTDKERVNARRFGRARVA